MGEYNELNHNQTENYQAEKFMVYEGSRLLVSNPDFGINEVRTVTGSDGKCSICDGPTAAFDKPLEGGWVVLCLNTSSMVITQDRFNEISVKLESSEKDPNEKDQYGRDPIGYITKMSVSVSQV